MSGHCPQRALLPDGRLHLQDGPIDLVIGLEGTRPAIAAAREAAWQALQGLLPALAEELSLLRTPLEGAPPVLRHPVARRMAEAAWPYRFPFATPMVAVAGAVAEHILSAIADVPGLTAAHVNNGGDIALHLSPGTSLRIGLAETPEALTPSGLLVIRAADPIRGVATSGWRGRSFSLGIADAVTVLAARAADADAAASIVANAVDVDHPAIQRCPARNLDPDSDLGTRPVTVAVENLPAALVAEALCRGLRRAEALIGRGLILGACLRLQGEVRIAGEVAMAALETGAA
ncbi:UPF0280 family protein [Roseococcus sp. YIM B11640]|uniref:UPF0280 family protein n=1 Tax=Roseococcus sp. YIM B11640 TaxID=3133973 RepID=UPI003C7AC30A